jgi:hypothetical protein
MEISRFWKETIWQPDWYARNKKAKGRPVLRSDEELRELLYPDTPSPRALEATEGEGMGDDDTMIARDVPRAPLASG